MTTNGDGLSSHLKSEQMLSAVNFIIVGLNSCSINEVRNALQCIRYIKGLNSKNIDDLKEPVKRLTKHKNQHVRDESSSIYRRLCFNYKGSLSIYPKSD